MHSGSVATPGREIGGTVKLLKPDLAEAAQTCFPEPARADARPGLASETRGQFLARSTWTRAVDLRRFYNVNLARLPAAAQTTLCRELKTDPTLSKHFELVVGRFLQELGATRLDYEVRGSEGRRVDWLGTLDDGHVSVEATVPVVNSVVGATIAASRELVDMAVRLAPPGWYVLVRSVPEFGPSERKTELREALRDLYAGVPAAHHGAHLTLMREFPNGSLGIDLFGHPDPSLPAQPGGGPAVGYFDDTSTVIHAAVEEKRRQARGATKPVILAICTNGFGSHEVEKFDIGLLGRTVHHLGSGRLSFNPSGAFGGGTGEPTFAGALAFAELGMRGGPDPILYVHPRFTGRLPAALLRLRRRFPTATGVCDVPATMSGVVERLDWPTT